MNPALAASIPRSAQQGIVQRAGLIQGAELLGTDFQSEDW